MSAIKSRAMQADEPGSGEFRLVHVDTPDPGPGQVRIAIEACGICHSDAEILSGHFPGVSFPCITGHELAGRIESTGAGVSGWQIGDRVVVGWYGGSCGHCAACRSGDGTNCPDRMVPGVAYPGGYADHIVVPAMGLAARAEHAPDQRARVRDIPRCRGHAAIRGSDRRAAVDRAGAVGGRRRRVRPHALRRGAVPDGPHHLTAIRRRGTA